MDPMLSELAASDVEDATSELMSVLMRNEGNGSVSSDSNSNGASGNTKETLGMLADHQYSHSSLENVNGSSNKLKDEDVKDGTDSVSLNRNVEDGSQNKTIKEKVEVRQKPGPKSKTRKGPPPELLPIEKNVTATNELNGSTTSTRDTPTRKAALKSAEVIKAMSQSGKSRHHPEEISVEAPNREKSADKSVVTIKTVTDPSINHCLNCNKMDCLVFQKEVKSGEESNFCSKRCVQQYFKNSQVQYADSSADGASGGAKSQQGIVIEPDIAIEASQSDLDVVDEGSDGGGAAAANGGAGQGGGSGVESVIESAARESLTCCTCRVSLYDVTDPFVWEAMEFCTVKCLSYYIKTVGVNCSQCRSRVGITVMGKLCVRFGSAVRQFCSSPCLEKFKVNHKLCSQCQVNMLNKDQVFCSLACEELHRHLRSKTDFLGQRFCAVCNVLKLARERITLHGQTQWLCSEPCRNAFRFANKVTTLSCAMCSQLFDSKALPRHVNRNIVPGKAMELSDLSWFCSATCHTTHLLRVRHIVPCTWCKVKKYNVDMIRKIVAAPHPLPPSNPASDHRSAKKETFFCSMYCLDLHDAASKNAPKTASKITETPVLYSKMPPLVPTNQAAPYNPVLSYTTPYASGAAVSAPATTSTPAAVSTISLTVHHGATTAATTTTNSTAGGSRLVPLEVHHKIVTTPALPKETRNKATWCRPVVSNRSAATSTDGLDDARDAKDFAVAGLNDEPDKSDKRPVFIPIPIPIPVPIYVPVPMGMYNFPCPFPLPFPLPLPAPLLLPVDPQRIADVQQSMARLASPASPLVHNSQGSLEDPPALKEETDPLEEELLHLAEALGSSNDGAQDRPPAPCEVDDVEEATDADGDVPAEEEDLELVLRPVKIVVMTPSGSNRKRTLSESTALADATPLAKRLKESQKQQRSSMSSSEGEEPNPIVLKSSFSQGKEGF